MGDQRTLGKYKEKSSSSSQRDGENDFAQAMNCQSLISTRDEGHDIATFAAPSHSGRLHRNGHRGFSGLIGPKFAQDDPHYCTEAQGRTSEGGLWSARSRIRSVGLEYVAKLRPAQQRIGDDALWDARVPPKRALDSLGGLRLKPGAARFSSEIDLRSPKASAARGS